MKKNHLYPNDYVPFNNKNENEIPASESSFLINLSGFVLAFLALCFIKHYSLVSSSICNILIFIAVFTLSIIAMEIIFGRKNNPIANISIKRSFNVKRCLTRLLALFSIWIIVSFFYWLFPVYNDNLYTTYFMVLKNYWWLLCILAVLYFAIEDMISKKTDDAYWQLGRWLLTHREDACKEDIIELFRGWGVKFFYLALMLPYFDFRLSWFMQADFSLMFQQPQDIFSYAEEFIFFIDLAVAAVGYIMTLNIFNTHIRSSEPTFFGWFVAIACYWPFYSDLFGRYYLDYGTGIYWQNVFANSAWFYVWTILILTCELIYSLSTIALGIRFSNLTYRGLITSGPYRFTKHPAYVFKNISWWLISMPFLAFNENPALAIKGTILLFGVNIIYYARARTEENHLSHYPEYVEYALAMNKKSIFAPIAKVLPFLKYKAPK